MAKNKNALGICVLPLPMEDSEPVTWERYKELTGIDLNDLFGVSLDLDSDPNEYYIRFKKGFSKIIALSSPYRSEEYVNDSVIPQIIPILPSMITTETNENADQARFVISVCEGNSAYGFYIHITADKNIGWYSL